MVINSVHTLHTIYFSTITLTNLLSLLNLCLVIKYESLEYEVNVKCKFALLLRLVLDKVSLDVLNGADA
jgi:hypothetical protein